jgi:hypothetical protein
MKDDRVEADAVDEGKRKDEIVDLVKCGARPRIEQGILDARMRGSCRASAQPGGLGWSRRAVEY